MADFTNLKDEIKSKIKSNGKQEITGAVLQQTMLEMIDETDRELTELSKKVEHKVDDLDNEINGAETKDYSDYQIRNGYIYTDGSIDIGTSGGYLQMDITGFIPVKQGDKVGEAVFTLDGREIGRVDIVADCDVERLGYFGVFLRMLGRFLMK